LKRDSFNDGEWTAARFRSFVTGALRTATRRWPPKYKALKEAFTGRQTNAKTGKLAMHYRCAECSSEFVSGDVQVDHKKPAVDPAKGFVSWDVYVDRLYCEASNLQVLCKECHAIKTAKERTERKNVKLLTVPEGKTPSGNVKGRTKTGRS
jgi:5-methylcytosine-specific restriction endonuclease McrA